MQNIDFASALRVFELAIRALDYSSEGISIADCSQPDMPLIYVNKGFEKITGYTAEEAVGVNCRYLQGKDREQTGRYIIKESLKEGKACKVTLKNYKKTGELFYNEFSLSPLFDSQGNLTHFIGIQSDVTIRELNSQTMEYMNDELEAGYAQMQELNNQLVELQSIMAHDIKNPLSIIMSGTELLNKKIELGKIEIPEIVTRIDKLNHTAKIALGLVNDFMQAKEIDMGKVTLKFEKLNLNAKIEYVTELYREKANEKQIVCELKLEVNDAKIWGDRNAVISILDNLLSNAVKYTEIGKKITIRLWQVGDLYKLSIRNEGMGFKPEELSKLYRQFQKLSARPTKNESSSGMGLYITKKYCDLMQANINVESEYGSYAEFVVTFEKSL